MPSLPAASASVDTTYRVVDDYIAAEAGWREATTDPMVLAADQVEAARQYVQAIDAYVLKLRASGRQVPHHIDEVAATLRATYGDALFSQRA